MELGLTEVTVGFVAVTILTVAVAVTEVFDTEVAVMMTVLGEGNRSREPSRLSVRANRSDPGKRGGKRPGDVVTSGIRGDVASRIVNGRSEQERLSRTHSGAGRRNDDADPGNDGQGCSRGLGRVGACAVAVIMTAGAIVVVPLEVVVGIVAGAV